MRVNSVRYRELWELDATRAKSHDACEGDTKTQINLQKRSEEPSLAYKQVGKALTIKEAGT